MKSKKKYLLLTVLSILSFVLITIGVTYSFFDYFKEGSTENSIEAGSISFIYEEVNKMGNGIKIEDALPVSDSEGKESSNYFDFKITANGSNTIAIPYEITARVTEGSDDISEYVKVYLTKLNGNSEEEKVLSIYSDLDDSTNALARVHSDKTLYTSEVPVGATNYTDNYRLRMWLNNDTNDGSVIDYSPVYQCSDTNYTTEADCTSHNEVWNPTNTYNNQGQTFSIKINVYANGEQATQEKIASANSVGINTATGNNNNLVLNTDETQNYDYSMNVSNDTESVTLNIEPTSPGATVSIESITEQQANTLRLSTSQTFNLNEGDNYFKVTITSANRQNSEVYVLKVKRGADSYVLKDKILEDNSTTKDIVIPDDELKYKSSVESSSTYQNGLFKATDVNGGYTYYFRGNVNNNYLKIGNDLWRIVRINEDGTIRIIKSDSIMNETYYTYNYFNNPEGYPVIHFTYFKTSPLYTTLNSWYDNNIQNNDNYKNIVTTGTYCQAYKVEGYEPFGSGDATPALRNQYIPSFECVNNDGNITDGILTNENIGLLTVDEVALAGGSLREESTLNYYLQFGNSFWTMSPSNTNGPDAHVWYVYTTGKLNYRKVTSQDNVYPVINLKANTRVTIDPETGYYVAVQ